MSEASLAVIFKIQNNQTEMIRFRNEPLNHSELLLFSGMDQKNDPLGSQTVLVSDFQTVVFIITPLWHKGKNELWDKLIPRKLLWRVFFINDNISIQVTSIQNSVKTTGPDFCPAV